MDTREISFRTEVKVNIKKKCTFSSTNFKRMLPQKCLKYSKLKFDHNILLNVLKKYTFKKN